MKDDIPDNIRCLLDEAMVGHAARVAEIKADPAAYGLPADVSDDTVSILATLLGMEAKGLVERRDEKLPTQWRAVIRPN